MADLKISGILMTQPPIIPSYTSVAFYLNFSSRKILSPEVTFGMHVSLNRGEQNSKTKNIKDLMI